MNDKMEKATAFVIKNGKFVDVGGEEILNKYSAKKILNLQQLPVYPGFIDSHCHFLSLGLSLQQVELVGTKSFDEVIQRVSKYSKGKNLNVILGRDGTKMIGPIKFFLIKQLLINYFRIFQLLFAGLTAMHC